MAATVTTGYPPTVRPPAVHPFSSSRQALLHRPSSSCCPLRPPRDEPALASSRLRVSLPTVGPRKRGLGLPLVLCSLEGQSETDQASPPSDSTARLHLNLEHPRRRLLVQFTCNECGERTQRLVNKLAYERGLIFVQCAGCLRHHKLVDNLGLVVEYDLREEIEMEQ
ncbi:hypothetical protein EUGRSUZ_G02379 [Eucalyptus grandis]|uniref:DNL-type domain-containing protein n=2 Tax=Eucalyptus grandis TaxID=71139 RepID=A0A059BFB3_EUCGR|nr:hypothetical protein EUGRSUZ_G02379 [Eucalyptus grandis]